LSRRGRVQRLGLARPVLVLFPADVHRLLYSGAFSGSADIRGDQGQGGNDKESMEGGLLASVHFLSTDATAAMPDSRHKLRNAGQVFATNRETRNLCGEIRLKQACGRC